MITGGNGGEMEKVVEEECVVISGALFVSPSVLAGNLAMYISSIILKGYPTILGIVFCFAINLSLVSLSIFNMLFDQKS